MTQERIQQLTQNYLEGTLSPAEWSELKAYLLMDGDHADFEARLMIALEQKDYESADRAVLERVLQKVHPTRPAHRVHFLKTTWFKYAAAVILTVGLGTLAYLWTTTNKPGPDFSKNSRQSKTEVPPGGERARLTLADGTTIILDSAANGTLANQGGVQVIKLANGQIAYDHRGTTSKEVMWNTMSTPKGGQYQLTLPDGTRAWLNAASSITFPAAFTGNKRQVKINGEVYFEVARSKQKPFIVDIDGKSTVEVLGTSFNINSYKEEQSITTTLIEGSIKIAHRDTAAAAASSSPQLIPSVILEPGQQAVLVPLDQQTQNAKGITVVSDPDLDQTLAWKNGIFNFNGADVQTVMRQLERWYDIKVVYEGRAPEIIFKGKMYRNVNFSDVLDMLKRMGVKCRMEGKTLIVLPK